MQVVSIISTKGGVGKTTTAANLGGLAADAGLRVLLLDLDVQPTLSSYYELTQRAPGGIYELLAFNERDLDQLVSGTIIAGLGPSAVQRPSGRAEHLVAACAGWPPAAAASAASACSLYDLVLIDTQGARSVLLEMAVLASDLALSPVTPEILAARELRRGTIQLLEDIAPYRHLGIEPPPLHLLINRVHPVSANARLIQQALRDLFQDHAGIRVLATDVRDRSLSAGRDARPAGASGRAPPAGRQSRPCRARHDARARQRVVPAMAGPTGSSIRPPAATS